MVSQSDSHSQAAIATEYDFAPQWLNSAESVEDAQNLLADLCTNYDIQRSSVLVGNQMRDDINWDVMLSSSDNVALADILPNGSLPAILNEELRRDKMAIARIPAIDEDTIRHLFCVVVDSKLPHIVVFVFESDNKYLFAELAALRLISDVLCKNFTENKIFVASNEREEQKLTHTESELLRLKSAGRSDEYLATAFKLSPHTIFYLLRRAIKKLGCPDTHSAVAKFSRLDQ